MSYKISFPGWGIEPAIDESTIYSFNMKIGSAYGDGGWPEGARQGEEFRNEVYPKLEKAGFKIQHSRDVGCDTIGRELSGITNRYVYLHPEQFSGYMTKDDIDKLKKVVDNCPLTIKGANEVFRCKPVLSISNDAYKHIIISKLPEIVKAYDQYGYRYAYDAKEFAQEFMKQYGIERAGGNSYGGLGFDFEVLSTALESLESVGYIQNLRQRYQPEGKMSYKALESAASYVMSELMDGADDDYAKQIKAEVGNDFLVQMGYSPLEVEEEAEEERE